VWILARELARRGINQTVVTSAGSELARRLGAAGIKVLPAVWEIGLDPRVLPVLLRTIPSAALLHAHDAHALTLAGVACLPSGTPFVVTRRVIFPLRHPFFWRRACRILAISSAVREALVGDGIDPARVVLIPSAIDPDVLETSTDDPTASLDLPPGSKLAVQLASLTPEKDQETLISAAARLVRDLPDLHWMIVGEGPLRRQLQHRIRELTLTDRVHLTGPLDDPHRALARADLFVLSSTSEGLGSSALAAMARGVPVVATRVGGLVDLLDSGAGVLIEPGDPAELAEAVHRVLSDSELRNQLVSRARAVARGFSASGMADQVLSVYRSCAHFFDGS
jgi:glycosyltransferase involved in cell wall biosynthesis